MKVPKAEKLKSGLYCIRLRIGGQSIAVKAATKGDAERQARLIKAKYAAKNELPSGSGMTVKEAYNDYIDAKRGVLSPSTVAGYERLRDHTFQGIMHLPLRSLSNMIIQREVSAMAKTRSPKSVANAVGLLGAVLKLAYPEYRLSVTMPQRGHSEPLEPKESDVAAIMSAVRGKSVELPTLLAMWLGLRMSEILGLTWDCIDGDRLHVKQARVDEGVKGTKTYGSDRWLTLPPYIKDLIEQRPRTGEFILPVTRGAIYDAFQKYTSRAGIQHYRFHDLRHLNTTIQLMMGIDNKTIARRNGWTTDAMIRSRYGHTTAERRTVADDFIDDYFTAELRKAAGDNLSPAAK
jgi:integrase